jgi:CRISPR-associated protein Cas1
LRVVEVLEHGRHISLDHGFLVVSHEHEECGRIAIDDVGALVLNAYGTSYTSPLVVALAERGAIIVTCGKTHLPVAWTLPISEHHAQVRIMAAQLGASKPLNKKLWQYVVKHKITSQAEALEAIGTSHTLIDAMVDMVHSGDPTNVEARAAQAYWPALFNHDFRRDREADGVNSLLNYGYTVLRASTARAVMACGLHPGVSIKHRRDPLALADDVMEPFRPLIDVQVADLAKQDVRHLTREVREILVETVNQTWTSLLSFVRTITAAYVDNVAPQWKRGTGVGTHLLRPTNGDPDRAQDRNEVSALPP